MPKIVKDRKQIVRAQSVALPEWMWDIVDKSGNRAKFFRDILKADKRFQEGASGEKE